MINGSANRIINLTRQKVYIDGSYTKLIRCTGCNDQTANFIIPSEKWDSRHKTQLHGKKVSVKVNDFYIFTGFIDGTNAVARPSQNEFQFGAKSVLEKLNHVWAGQHENQLFYNNYVFGIHTLDQILEDFFDVLPHYGNIIRLGNLSAIRDKAYNFGERFEISNWTYQQLLDTALSFCGDVTWKPRFTSFGAYIDLYRINNASNPTSYVTLGRYGENGKYSNIIDFNEDINSSETIDKVICYGSPKQFIISFCSADINPLTSTAVPAHMKLIPDWDESLETLVSQNQEATKRGSPGYVAGAEWVGTRYKIPDIGEYTALKELPIQKSVDESGNIQYYKLQAYQWKTTLVANPASSEQAVTGTLGTEPVIVDCDFQLDNGYVIFSKPTFNIIKTEIVTDSVGKTLPKRTYEIAPVGITIAVETKKHQLFYETPSVSDFPNTYNYPRLDYKYSQLTNIGYNWTNNAGDNLLFDEVLIFYEDTASGQIITSKTIIKDDTQQVQATALEVLKEKFHRSKQLDITIPMVTNNYKVGNRLVVENTDQFDSDQFAICSVQYDLVKYTTTITACNDKPLKFSEFNA